jgi:hypothetical protein
MNRINRKGLQQPLNVASPKASMPNNVSNNKVNNNLSPIVRNPIRRLPRNRNARFFQQIRPSPAFSGRGVQTSAAAAYSTGQSSYAPRITASRDQSRIVHRELIASITGSVAYVNGLTFPLNPGLSQSFPWLSTQAQAWEQYHFNSLKFCYYTRTGSATPGSVLLIPDYDAADAAPVSEVIASSYEDVREDVPWKDIECPLRVAAMHPDGPKKYIRSGLLTPNLDIKTYDVGNLFVGTTDGTAVPWGKLWVEYDIVLHTPQLNPGGIVGSGFQLTVGATPTTANILGAAPTSALNSTPFVTVAGSVLTFNQAGTFQVTLEEGATTSITQNVAPAVGAGNTMCTSLGAVSVAGSGTAALIQVNCVKAVVGGTLTYNNTIVAGLEGNLLVMPISSLFV